MSLVLGINEVLTCKDMLLSFSDNGINSISNMITKINYNINNNLTKYDNIYRTFNNEIANESLTNMIDSNYNNVLDITNMLPVKIRINIVNNEVYFFIGGEIVIVSIDNYNNIINNKDSFVIKIDENDLLKDERKCINDECYFLYTRVNLLHGLNINFNQITSLGLEYDNIVYMYIDTPSIYKDLILSKINNYSGYIVDTIKTYKPFNSNTFLENIFTKHMEDIKNNRVRDFILNVRKHCKGKSLTKNDDIIYIYNYISKKISSEWSKLKNSELVEDFPELANIDDFNNMETIKMLIVGNKHNLSINTETDYPLITNKLNRLKENLNSTK